MNAPENAQELLPCPFCGGPGHLVKGWIWLGCPKCELSIHLSFETEADGIAYWNTRHPAPQNKAPQESTRSDGNDHAAPCKTADEPKTHAIAPNPQVSEEELNDLVPPLYNDEGAYVWKAGYRAASDRWAKRVAELELQVKELELVRDAFKMVNARKDATIAKLEARIGALREALSWYATIHNWRGLPNDRSQVRVICEPLEQISDEHVGGKRARAVLAADDKERT